MSSSENRKENKEDNKIGLIVKIDPREQNLDWISKICENGHLQVIAVIRNSTDINDLNLPENGRNYVLELGFGEKLRKFDFSEPLTDDVYNIPIFWGDDQGDILEKWKTVEPRLYAYPRDISPDLSVEIKKEIYGGVELANLSRFELEPVKTIFTTFTLKDEDYGFLSSTHWYGLCKIGKKCLSAGLKKRAL